MESVSEKRIMEAEAAREAARLEKLDFKMVTFTLAGKDYGIDIMKVKEISKANRFTYVPNSVPYVRGVYNLRGDIISVIDLRIMFNLLEEKKSEQALENMIILRLDDYLIGTIVDSIDKVISISSETIQPPHPIFGDINIKFIKGVVENAGRLYLILDVEKIFGLKGGEETVAVERHPEETSSQLEQMEPAVKTVEKTAHGEDQNLQFIIENLKNFKNFSTTEINRAWVSERYNEWKRLKGNKSDDLQLQETKDADDYLKPFFSSFSGIFWGIDYIETMKSLISNITPGGRVTAWNAGCGKGYETYSLAVIMRELFPEAAIKIWANDNDLLSISTAPNLLFQKNEIPESFDSYVVKGKNGFQFSQEIRDLILFEYHNVLHPNPFPEVDIILARDILSFLSPSEQQQLIKEFEDKLRPGGLLILGSHENAYGPAWVKIEQSGISAFRKENG